MKLRNKKTGEIGDIAQTSADCIIVYYPIVDGVATNPQKRAIYTSLDQLNEEWEDYEEPKLIYYINYNGDVHSESSGYDWKYEKAIGNYFETREEAKKAVEKLKAWKRLKDNGFKFEGWKRDEKYCGDYTINATDQTSCDDEDLDLLFGGGEK